MIHHPRITFLPTADDAPIQPDRVSITSSPMQPVTLEASYWQASYGAIQATMRSEPFKAAAIIARVADANNLTTADILGKNRARRFAYARQEAMLAIRDELGWSYPRIAQRFKCDHSSVMYSVKKCRARQYEQGKAA